MLVGARVGVGVGVGVSVGIIVLVGVGVGVSVGVGLGVTVGVGVGVFVGTGVGVEVGVGVGVFVGTEVGVGVSAGSWKDKLFCGSGILRSTKSFALLSVSSPFPSNASIPIIVADVAVLFARRSRLVFAAGFVSVAPSKSSAPPKPTLSITFDPASYKSTVLSEEIDAELVA